VSARLVVLALALVACGGSVDPTDVATTRSCYLKFQPEGTDNAIACTASNDWTFTEDAGVFDCVGSACPLGVSCAVNGEAGTCR
jgi:hypothetical protein